MYFWLKVAHITSMAVWFTGLFFLPRLFVARHRSERDARAGFFNPVANRLFFRIATPAGVATIALGMALMPWVQPSAWLVAKLAVVTLALLLHLYLGLHLYALGHGKDKHGATFYQWLGWVPLLLLLAAAALTGAKPRGGFDPPPAPVNPGMPAAIHSPGASSAP
jgi:protoporphyrinogen IX oxidase